MRIIFLLVIVVALFSCKSETKKKVSIQKVEVDKENAIENRKEVVEKTMLQSSVNVKKQDYSLRKENIKTQKDSVSFLKHYYNQYKKEKDSLSEILFFEVFPNSFNAFNNLYGYSEEEGERPLYNDYHLLDYDAIRKNVSDVDYYNKLIMLSEKGKWEADNVATLQEVIVVNFTKKPKIFLDCLKKSEIDLDGFWYYFFDSPHPDDPDIKGTYDIIIEDLKQIDSTMITIVEKAYLRVKKDWLEH